MEIEVEIDENVFLPCYRHLSEGEFDIDFYYGGRDSGKSRDVAMRLIRECLSLSYFKCILTRKVGDTIKESQWDLIKTVCEEWGIDHLFKFHISPLEIRCVNGNRFITRGLDDVAKIKSVNNPSHCWVEEGNQIDADDMTVILTSLRFNGGNAKTFFTFNPECEGNYTEFWLWQEWFSHTTNLSWTWNKSVETLDGPVYFNTRATHTTYHDNPYCSSQRKALYEGYKNSKNNAYYYQTYTLGLWGFRISGGNFCKSFEESRHVEDLMPIDSTYHIVVDNNVSPYISIQLWQIDIENKRLLQIGELPCSHPNNSAKRAANQAGKWLIDRDYKETVYIYGDPSANAKSTNDDAGRSFFDKFKAELEEMNLRIEDRVQRSAPRVAMSGSFLNDIWEKSYAGWSIITDTGCRKTIEDYQMAKEASDGTILKKKIKDKHTGISYEQYGHWIDDTRYFVTTVLAEEYEEYQNRDSYYIERVN